MTPEAKAREKIDQKLTQAGWLVQDLKQPTLVPRPAWRCANTRPTPVRRTTCCSSTAAPSASSRPSATRRAQNLTAHEAQTERYASATLKWRGQQPRCPSCSRAPARSSASPTAATRRRAPAKSFTSSGPKQLAEWLDQPDTLRRRLADNMPALPAATCATARSAPSPGWKNSLALNKPRALVHMATGAGKTFTAITVGLPAAQVRRGQAHPVSGRYAQPGQAGRTRSSWPTPRPTTAASSPSCTTSSAWPAAPSTRTPRSCISTIQRMYSVLSGEPIDDSAEDISLNEVQQTAKQAKLVALQPGRARRDLRLHRHRRMPPLHLQPVEAGARLLRRLPHRPDRHARQAHLRLLQREHRRRIQLRAVGGRWRQRRLRRVLDRDRHHPERRRTQGQRVGRSPRPADAQEALAGNRGRHALHRQGTRPLGRQPEPDPAGDPGHENGGRNAHLSRAARRRPRP